MHGVLGPSSCGLDDVSRACSARPQNPGSLPVFTNIRHMSRRLRACVPASTTTMTNAGSAILAKRSFMLVEGWRSARTADIRSTPPPIKVLPIDVLASGHTHPHASILMNFRLARTGNGSDKFYLNLIMALEHEKFYLILVSRRECNHCPRPSTASRHDAAVVFG